MLTGEEIALIKKIVYSILDPKLYSVFIFGSRATGTDQKFSDIDIGIEGQVLHANVRLEIEEAFEESDLPYNVEIVDFSRVRKNFREVAKQKIIPL